MRNDCRCHIDELLGIVCDCCSSSLLIARNIVHTLTLNLSLCLSCEHSRARIDCSSILWNDDVIRSLEDVFIHLHRYICNHYCIYIIRYRFLAFSITGADDDGAAVDAECVVDFHTTLVKPNLENTREKI